MTPSGFEYALNFSADLTEIILETKYMEQLGFPVPKLARSVALQEEKFTSYQDGIKKCLQRYQACIASLEPAEVRFFLCLPHPWNTRDHFSPFILIHKA